MPPYAPRVLKRKYGGRYQSAKKQKMSRSRTVLSSRVGLWSRYSRPSPMVELKFIDQAWDFSMPSAGSTFLLNPIGNGTDDFQRIGKSVQLKNLNLNLLISLGSTGFVNNIKYGRTIIVLDLQTNGALPSTTDILESASPISLFNSDQRGRFKVLFDKVHELSRGNAGEPTELKNNIILDLAIPLYSKQEFTGTANNIASIDKGAIICLCVAETDLTMRVIGNSRIQYTDN